MLKIVVCGAAGATWAVVVLDAMGAMPGHDGAVARAALGAAVCLTMRLMLWAHDKPQAEAFDLGVELGRREAIRELNSRPVSALRPDPNGLTAFNHAARRRRLRVDA